MYQGRLQRVLFGRFDLAGETRRIKESLTDPGRTVYAAEWGTRLSSDLRIGVGYGSGAFAVAGSVLRASALRGGVYVIVSSTLSQLFDLMPGAPPRLPR